MGKGPSGWRQCWAGDQPGWESQVEAQATGLRLSIPHSRARKEGVGGGAAAVKRETPSGGELPPGPMGGGGVAGGGRGEKLKSWPDGHDLTWVARAAMS